MEPWPQPWPRALARVVAVVPHPDDEVFLAGLLATAASAGASVTLICATRGEGGWLHGKRSTANVVSATRAPELEASCAAIGIKTLVHLDLPDGGVEATDAEHRRALGDALDAARPDLIVTYDVDGGYGHRDHLAVVDLVAAFAGELSARWLRVAFPEGLFAELTASLRRFQPDLLGEIPSVALKPITWSIDLDGTLADIKRQAARAHGSQLNAEGVFLFASLEAEIFSRELYRE